MSDNDGVSGDFTLRIAVAEDDHEMMKRRAKILRKTAAAMLAKARELEKIAFNGNCDPRIPERS